MTAFEIGLAFQTDKPHGRYGELAVAAEARGFDVVSVFADLLYQPPLPALLEMARATSLVRRQRQPGGGGAGQGAGTGGGGVELLGREVLPLLRR